MRDDDRPSPEKNTQLSSRLMDITDPTEQHIGERHYQGYGVDFCPITPRDLPSLRRWRNSPQISKQMTDASYINAHQQRGWYENIKARNDQAHWMVWFKGVRAGYANIKGVVPLALQRELAGGFISGNSSVKNGLLGYAMILMQLDIAFEHLSAITFKGPVLKTNHSARRLNKEMGYLEEWETDTMIGVVLTKDNYRIAKCRFHRYFLNPQCVLIS